MRKGALLALCSAAALLMLVTPVRAQTADTSPPSAPTNVTASLSLYAQVNVSWTASVDNVGVTGYHLYRNGSLIANTPNTSYTDSVTPGATYSYTVTAYDAAGNVSFQSAPSAPLAVLKDTTPPSAPVWISLVPATSSVALSWTASTDNVGVAGYLVYRNGNKIPEITGYLTGTTYTDTGLLPGNNFTYRVIAYDLAGNSAESNTANVTTVADITPPTAPASLYATAKSSNEIDVNWQPSSDNVGIAGYYVYRDGSQIANVSSSPYADTNLSALTSHLYTIAAYDAAGNVSPQSFGVQATTLAPDTQSPTTPLNFTAKPVSPSEIDFTWMASTDNVGVMGYYLDRNYARVATIASSATAYADTGLTTSTNYIYTLQAFDAAGNLSSQAALSVSTLATTPAPLPTSTISSLPTPVVTTPTTAPAATPAVTVAPVFTLTLSFGMQNSDVKNLQTFLIAQGYLGPGYATGFFGSLTQSAVQKFQCAEEVVCTGTPQTTGWGLVGPKTRTALNAAASGSSGASASSAPTTSVAPSASASPSVQQLEAELQALQAELSALQQKAGQ
jgi:chitodextrinase